jgi:hypothetical protein
MQTILIVTNLTNPRISGIFSINDEEHWRNLLETLIKARLDEGYCWKIVRVVVWN